MENYPTDTCIPTNYQQHVVKSANQLPTQIIEHQNIHKAEATCDIRNIPNRQFLLPPPYIQSNPKPTLSNIASAAERKILINNYLPTTMTGSEPQYRENLDKISSKIDKYDDSHSIIITGDLNGSLITTRNNNHNQVLKEFSRKHHLTHTLENSQGTTFSHQKGKSCSQIDYILENNDKDILRSTTIEDRYHLNGSAHAPIRAKSNMSIASDKIKGKKSNLVLDA
ncbi:unnamed protein product [Mytilus coruscus]|uniref:Endonuclease/exonuclease/phosphatase domain-containing protein n=1 Tax=Mytilus coruscus TaxID=42192 RepID=A0A6J8A6L5_MYTCO|nr:unnamed protein product [Mytilus coruscus]